MKTLKLKLKTLENFKGELPAYQSTGASGFDVRAQLVEPMRLEPGQRALVPTGLAPEVVGLQSTD
jgi:dUTP pyrophosphatase